jgi:cytochrome P450
VTNSARQPPAAGGLLGSGLALLRDPVRAFYDGWRRRGDVVRFRLTPLPVALYLVAQPDDVSRVLHHANYRKVPGQTAQLKDVLGEGLFTADGDLWSRQRRLMQLVLHRQRCGLVARLAVSATRAMLEAWRASGAGAETIDVEPAIRRLTLRILLRLLFSDDGGDEFERIHQSVTVLDRHLNLVEQASFLAPRWMASPKSPRAAFAQRWLDAWIYRRIAERRQARRGQESPAYEPDDLLSAMLTVSAADAGRMSDEQVRDEIVTLIMGDRVTVPVLLWMLLAVAQHPPVENRLRHEVARIIGSRAVGADDLPHLPYNGRVFAEVLRLYPPAWLTARMTIDDDLLGGYLVPGGSRVIVCPYITQRHPDYWSDPNRFDPDRFETIGARPRYAYFPFGGGARTCIAGTLAAVEAQVIVTTVAQHCRLRVAGGARVSAIADPLLTPHPMPRMRIEWAPTLAAPARADAKVMAARCPVVH